MPTGTTGIKVREDRGAATSTFIYISSSNSISQSLWVFCSIGTFCFQSSKSWIDGQIFHWMTFWSFPNLVNFYEVNNCEQMTIYWASAAVAIESICTPVSQKWNRSKSFKSFYVFFLWRRSRSKHWLFHFTNVFLQVSYYIHINNFFSDVIFVPRLAQLWQKVRVCFH